MREAVISTFDKIHSQYAADYSCTSQTCASDNGCAKIFFSCFLSLAQQQYCHQILLLSASSYVQLAVSQINKCDMFSAEVKTKALKGNDSIERKKTFDQSALKIYNCQK